MNSWKEAILGITEYFTVNKLIAVCFAVLLYEFFAKKKRIPFIKYSLGVLLLLLCPVTAGILLKYQPMIYEDGFLWTLMPVSGLCAYGGVSLLWDVLPCTEKSGKGKYIVGACAVLGIGFLLGNRGLLQGGTPEDAEERRCYGQVAEALTEETILWGPRDLMQWVRSRDGGVKLIYGMDMWDGVAAAYDGDAYGQEMIAAYEWMQSVEGFAYQLEITTDAVLPVPQELMDNMQSALESMEALGVNTIVLPAGVYQRLEGQLSKEYEVQTVEDYTLLRGMN